MAKHNDLGKIGERKAAEYLEEHGYEILERNWEFMKAEIDLIVRKGNMLAIVEVKTRSTIDFGLPQEFVTDKKIRLLIRAVNEYVTSNELDVDVRFDIIAILHNNGNFVIEHFEDAFYHF